MLKQKLKSLEFYHTNYFKFKKDVWGMVYSPILIERLYQDFKKGTSLSDLHNSFGKTEYGLLQKLRRLQKEDPKKWDVNRIREYQREYHERHKKEIRKYSKEYRKQHNKEISKKQKIWREKHPNYSSNYMEEWKKKHPDYNKKLREKHKKERPYIGFGDFLIEKLIMMDKKPIWLINKLGISKQTIYSYLNGLSCPKQDVRRKICEVFEIKTKNLEKMLEIVS